MALASSPVSSGAFVIRPIVLLTGVHWEREVLYNVYRPYSAFKKKKKQKKEIFLKK